MSRPNHEIDAAVRDALDATLSDVHAGDDLLARIHEKAAEAPYRRAAPRRAPWVAAAAAVFVAASVGTALVLAGAPDGGQDTVVGLAGGAEATVLPPPGEGEAVPELLSDGTPVWVVGHDDGTVSVLDAVSGHRPYGIGNLVAWCDESRGFQDPRYGSMFDERGRRRGGPAAVGLGVYETVAGGDATVTVAPDAEATPLPDTDEDVRGRGAPDRASCFDPEPDSPDNVGSARVHSVAERPGVSVAEAVQRPGETVLVRDASILVASEGPSMLCDPARGRPAGVDCTGPVVTGLTVVDDGQAVVVSGTFVVKVGGDGLVSNVAAVEGLRSEPVEASGGPTVAVSTSNLGPLAVTTPQLVASPGAWMEHTVTVENTGDETVYVNDHRQGLLLGDRELLAADEGCGYGNVPGRPAEVVCQADYLPITLAPGARESWTVTLWVALPGMSDLGAEPLVWRKPFVYDDEPFSAPGDGQGTAGELVFTYENLDRADGSAEEAGTEPEGGDVPILQESACDGGACGSTFTIGRERFGVSCGPVRPEVVTDEVLAEGTFAGGDTEVRRIADVDPAVLVAIRRPGGVCGDEDAAVSEWSMALPAGAARPDVQAAICKATFEEHYERNGCPTGG